MSSLVKPFIYDKLKYHELLRKIGEAEENLKKTFGIEDFDELLNNFNNQHTNHTLFLMKCAYRAGRTGKMSGNISKMQIVRRYLCYNEMVNK